MITTTVLPVCLLNKYVRKLINIVHCCGTSYALCLIKHTNNRVYGYMVPVFAICIRNYRKADL